MCLSVSRPRLCVACCLRHRALVFASSSRGCCCAAHSQLPRSCLQLGVCGPLTLLPPLLLLCWASSELPGTPFWVGCWCDVWHAGVLCVCCRCSPPPTHTCALLGLSLSSSSLSVPRAGSGTPAVDCLLCGTGWFHAAALQPVWSCCRCVRADCTKHVHAFGGQSLLIRTAAAAAERCACTVVTTRSHEACLRCWPSWLHESIRLDVVCFTTCCQVAWGKKKTGTQTQACRR